MSNVSEIGKIEALSTSCHVNYYSIPYIFYFECDFKAKDIQILRGKFTSHGYSIAWRFMIAALVCFPRWSFLIGSLKGNIKTNNSKNILELFKYFSA